MSDYITPAQRATTLRAALEAHYNVSLPGAEWMIEATINAALGQAPFAATLGVGRLKMCPVSERPCRMPMVCEANENGCVNHRCRHLRTAQVVVGDAPTTMRVETHCVDCGEVTP